MITQRLTDEEIFNAQFLWASMKDVSIDTLGGVYIRKHKG